jgi:hypothetical protein
MSHIRLCSTGVLNLAQETIHPIFTQFIFGLTRLPADVIPITTLGRVLYFFLGLTLPTLTCPCRGRSALRSRMTFLLDVSWLGQREGG